MDGVLEIVVWGARGSIPISNAAVMTYGGCTSCVQVIADNGAHIIFDGGSGIHALGNKYIEEGFPDNPAIFISHAHWDHIQGIPFFTPAFIPGNRIRFFGCNHGTVSFRDILKNQMESPYFPVTLASWQADITISSIGETTVDIDGIKVTSSYAEHPGMTLGYRLDYKGKSIVYLPDNEPFAKFDTEAVFVNRSHEEEMGMETVFLEDQKAKFFGFIHDADVLIHDAQYTPEEYKRKVGWGHSNYEMAVRIGLYGNVRHLVLFHHDASRSDAEVGTIVKTCRRMVADSGGSMEVTAACQGAAPLQLVG